MIHYDRVTYSNIGVNFSNQINNILLPILIEFHSFSDKYASQFGAGSSYAYFHDEDESTFHLVDTTRVQKPPYQRGRARGQRGRGARGARTPGGMTTLNKGNYMRNVSYLLSTP